MLLHLITHFIDSELKLFFPKLNKENKQERETDFLGTGLEGVRQAWGEGPARALLSEVPSSVHGERGSQGCEDRKSGFVSRLCLNVCVILSTSFGLLKHFLAVKIRIMMPTPECSSEFFKSHEPRAEHSVYTQVAVVAGVISQHLQQPR